MERLGPFDARRTARIEAGTLAGGAIILAVVTGLAVGGPAVGRLVAGLVAGAAFGAAGWWSHTVRWGRDLADPQPRRDDPDDRAVRAMTWVWIVAIAVSFVLGAVRGGLGSLAWGVLAAALFGAWFACAHGEPQAQSQ